ncbi:hypothetical protein AB4Y43_17250, partial [Paraburkholderia sp. BR10872]|uniref:hypothetical protein n=1 Tax=Paraburkholderia sp. BR10872 TaxID=3236989 RepID=UPI0034D1E527
SAVAFAIAGVFGGLVASSIPYYRTFKEFEDARLGAWKAKRICVNSLTCTHLEHAAFWAGCVIAIAGISWVMVPVVWSNFRATTSVTATTSPRLEQLKQKCDLYGYVRGTSQHADCVRILDSPPAGRG